MRNRVAWEVAAVAAVLLAGGASVAAARDRHHVPGTCGVMSGRDCNPTVCSVFDRHPCAPDAQTPVGQDLRLTIDSKGTAERIKPTHELDTLADLFAELRACWMPPPASESHHGMQMSIRLSLKRTGEVIAVPRVTFTTPNVPSQVRLTYRQSIAAAFDRCAPFPITKGLGGAIAGKPIMIRYIDDRDPNEFQDDKQQISERP